MTISLNETVEAFRREFRDVSWSNNTIKEWIKDAVREYSIHFPVTGTLEDDATDDVYEYDFFEGTHDEEDLPVVFGVIEFEYPTGEDPPEYPKRMDHTDASFFEDGESYYDIVLNPAMNNGEIWLSEPETGDTFQVKYLTEHTWTSVDSDTDENTEVPSNHRPIIVQYVVCKAWGEKITQLNEEDDIKLYDKFEKRLTIENKKLAFILDQTKGSRPTESKTIQWTMDKFDRIY